MSHNGDAQPRLPALSRLVVEDRLNLLQPSLLQEEIGTLDSARLPSSTSVDDQENQHQRQQQDTITHSLPSSQSLNSILVTSDDDNNGQTINVSNNENMNNNGAPDSPRTAPARSLMSLFSRYNINRHNNPNNNNNNGNNLSTLELSEVFVNDTSFSTMWRKIMFSQSSWQLLVILVQTSFICAKIGFKHIYYAATWLGILGSWFVIFSPLFIAFCVVGISLAVWICFDVAKLLRRRQRIARRLQRFLISRQTQQMLARNNSSNSLSDNQSQPSSSQQAQQQDGATAAASSQSSTSAATTSTEQLTNEFMRNYNNGSGRLSRRRRFEYTERFLAYSTLVGLLLAFLTCILLALNLDSLTRIPYYALLTPMVLFVIASAIASVIIATFSMKKIVQSRATIIVWSIFATLPLVCFVFLLCAKLDNWGSAAVSSRFSSFIIAIPLVVNSLFTVLWCIRFLFTSLRQTQQSLHEGSKFLYDIVPTPLVQSIFSFVSLLFIEAVKSRRQHEQLLPVLLKRRRLDALVVIIVQIPLLIFLGLLCFYSEYSAFTATDVLVAFTPLFVAEMFVFTWVIMRDKILIVFGAQQQQEELNNTSIVLPVRAINNTEQGAAATTGAASGGATGAAGGDDNPITRSRERQFGLMLMALHDILQRQQRQQLQNGAADGSNAQQQQQQQQIDADQLSNAAVMQWLQHLHQFEDGAPFRINTQPRNNGLSQDFLQLLPTYRYTRRNTEEAPEPCSICLSDFEDGETLKTLQCFHRFHVKCIDDWLSVSNLCPICKYRVDQIHS